MKEPSTDLPSCCHFHEGSRAIKSSSPQRGLYAYITWVRIRKKRQIRSTLLLDMPRSNNHEALSWRDFNEQRIHHAFVEMEMQPTAPAQSSVWIWHCLWFFFSGASGKQAWQRQRRVGQSWNPSSTYQSIIREQASRQISTMMIRVLTSCPLRSAFLKPPRTLHSLHSLQPFSNRWQRKLKL